MLVSNLESPEKFEYVGFLEKRKGKRRAAFQGTCVGLVCKGDTVSPFWGILRHVAMEVAKNFFGVTWVRQNCGYVYVPTKDKIKGKEKGIRNTWSHLCLSHLKNANFGLWTPWPAMTRSRKCFHNGWCSMLKTYFQPETVPQACSASGLSRSLCTGPRCCWNAFLIDLVVSSKLSLTFRLTSMHPYFAVACACISAVLCCGHCMIKMYSQKQRH